MAETGVIRRLDELGRLVIPSDFRKMLHWNPGDPILMSFCAKNSLLLVKFRELEPLRVIAAEYAGAFYETYKVPVALCDDEHFLAQEGFGIAGDLSISLEARAFIEEKQEFQQDDAYVLPISREPAFCGSALVPITFKNRGIGALLLGKAPPGTQMEPLMTALRLTAKMIESQLQ